MKWEYKTIKFETKGFVGGKFDENQIDEVINTHGKDGWEIATAFDTNQAYGESRYIVIILKREIK